MGPATGLSCPHSLVADGPLEADALRALKETVRVNFGLDRLELGEAVRAPWLSELLRVFESAAPAVTWKKKGAAVKSKTVNDCDGAIREALPSSLVLPSRLV